MDHGRLQAQWIPMQVPRTGRLQSRRATGQAVQRDVHVPRKRRAVPRVPERQPVVRRVPAPGHQLPRHSRHGVDRRELQSRQGRSQSIVVPKVIDENRIVDAFSVNNNFKKYFHSENKNVKTRFPSLIKSLPIVRNNCVYGLTVFRIDRQGCTTSSLQSNALA